MIVLNMINDHIFCNVIINERTALMLFDTGATISHISSDYIANSKLVGYVKGAGQTGVLGNKKEVREIQNIEIDHLLSDLHRFVINDAIKEHFPGCDGLIGMDLLSKMNIRINFDQMNFAFTTDKVKDGIPFTTNKNKIYFNPKINGKVVQNLVFDTGATNLTIETELRSKLNLQLLENGPELVIDDSNGNSIDFETYLLDSFELKNFVKRDIVSYGFCFKKSSHLKGIKQNGIIGISILENHNITFDFESKQCVIK
jgi:Aspartyl protease/Retroviral aspartyl protease